MFGSSSRAVVMAALVVSWGVMVGCGGNNEPGSQQPADMTAQPDMVVDMRGGDADMPEDMTPEDMPVDMTPEDMPVDMTPEDMPVDMTPEDMPVDMFMEPDLPAYPCAYPASDPACPPGDYGPGSFVTSFDIATDEQCCHDLDGDTTLDNFIGSRLISLAGSFGGVDVNANIRSAITQGRLVYLMEFEDFENDRYDSDLKLRFLTGADVDGSFGDNLTGSGRFYVDPNSFDATGKPRWEFSSAYVRDGMLHAEGGELQIYFPGLVDEVDIVLRNLVLDATVTPGANLAAGGSVELTQGTLSGGIMMERFYDSMNVVANQCACLGQDVFTKQYDEMANGKRQPYYDCALSSSACANDPDDACQTIGNQQLCFFLGISSKSADVDTDNDGVKDAFSFGTRLESKTTTLVKFR